MHRWLDRRLLSRASNRSLSTDETQSWRWNSSQMILLLTLPCVWATCRFVNIWDKDCRTLDDLSCIKVCQRKMIACKLVFSCNIPTRAIFFSWLLPLSFVDILGKWVLPKVATKLATNVLWSEKQHVHLLWVSQVCFSTNICEGVCVHTWSIYSD